MQPKFSFKITCVTYRSRTIAYRVSGSLKGKQVRKNFKTRKEASALRERLEIERLNSQQEGSFRWVSLSAQEFDDAIASARRLRPTGKSLSDAVDFFLKNFRESKNEKFIGTAISEYLEVKSREVERNIISARHYRGIRVEMHRFKDSYEDFTVAEITPSHLEKYLHQGGPALKTWNNRRGYLSTFFKYCDAKDYLSENPVTDLAHYRIRQRRATAKTLTANQVRDLMTYLEDYPEANTAAVRYLGSKGCMVPYFALCLFAGIRPDWEDGEIGKIRPEHINMETGVIHLEPEVSKVNEKRIIKIQPNLALWMERYPVDKYPIIPPTSFREMRIDIRKRFNLGYDILRHTFISMLVGAFRSVGDAALQAGNSESIIRRYYLDLKSEEEADGFWRISPAGTSLPAQLQKDRGRYRPV